MASETGGVEELEGTGDAGKDTTRSDGTMVEDDDDDDDDEVPPCQLTTFLCYQLTPIVCLSIDTRPCPIN